MNKSPDSEKGKIRPDEKKRAAPIANGATEIVFIHFKAADEEEGVAGYHLIEDEMPPRPREIARN